MKFGVVVVGVVLLSSLGGVVVADHYTGGEGSQNFKTTKVVCTEPSVMSDGACAAVSLRSSRYCEFYHDTVSDWHCAVQSVFDLNVTSSSGDGSARAWATSQAVPGERVVTWAGGTNKSQPATHQYYDIPDGGNTVVYWNEVCIQFTVPSTSPTAATEPTCSTWPHAVDLKAVGTCCVDPVAFYTGASGIAEATARNTAVPPTGPTIQDRSTERVCGANTRIDVGCAVARVLHSAPSCAGQTGSKTCSVEYWLNVTVGIGGGCALAWTDQFSEKVTNCLDRSERNCEDIAPGVRRCEPSPDFVLAGPFKATYSDVPSDGVEFDVWATVCLGNGIPQGQEGSEYSQCTIWSPATIQLPGA